MEFSRARTYSSPEFRTSSILMKYSESSYPKPTPKHFLDLGAFTGRFTGPNRFWGSGQVRSPVPERFSHANRHINAPGVQKMCGLGSRIWRFRSFHQIRASAEFRGAIRPRNILITYLLRPISTEFWGATPQWRSDSKSGQNLGSDSQKLVSEGKVTRSCGLICVFEKQRMAKLSFFLKL